MPTNSCAMLFGRPPLSRLPAGGGRLCRGPQFQFPGPHLSEIGFAGAAFAILMGLKPLTGMLIFALLGSIGVGELSMQAEQKESSISAISAFFVGLGILFCPCPAQPAATRPTFCSGPLSGVQIQRLSAGRPVSGCLIDHFCHPAAPEL